jgi:hypothetical protein
MIETPPKSHDAARIRELEELWALPASPESGVSPRAGGAAVRDVLLRHLGKILASGWIGLFVAGAFAPAAEPEAATPVWAGALIGALFVALLGALAFSPISRRAAFGAAIGAGALGMALAVGCRVTEHHGGSWWAYELGATFALTALAALGLRRSSRVS